MAESRPRQKLREQRHVSELALPAAVGFGHAGEAVMPGSTLRSTSAPRRAPASRRWTGHDAGPSKAEER
jgi:hypothetical protein